MNLDLELSTKEYEKFLLGRLGERFTTIKWGENCDSVKEALTFSEEWLFKNTLDASLHQEMQEYLFKQGFTPKMTILNGKKCSSWTLLESKNPAFEKVKKEFEKSFSSAVSYWEKQAVERIIDFSYSMAWVIDVRVGNRIFREFMVNKLAQYNRDLMFAKNTKLQGENRPYIYYGFTSHMDTVIMSKKSDLSHRIESAEARYAKEYEDWISFFLGASQSQLSYYRYSSVPRKLATYVPVHLVEAYRNFFEKTGIDMSCQAKYLERNYVCIGTWQEGLIPVFLEVPNLVYKNISSNYRINGLYVSFCNFFR